MDIPGFRPTDSILFLTNRVGRQLSNLVRRAVDLEDFDVLPQHMGVLVDLWVKDGLRQQDLAVALIKDKATIARALRDLEERNIVVRIADAADKRNKRIYLTHKGKELKQKLIPLAEKATGFAAENISEEEIKICKKVLSQMYHNLNSCVRNQFEANQSATKTQE